MKAAVVKAKVVPDEREAIKGWLTGGRARRDYHVSIDYDESRDGSGCAKVQAVAAPTDFITLMQRFIPDEYRGHRIRLSGWLKTTNVEGACHLWMRVNAGDRRIISFGQSSPLNGTNAWKQYRVVLDIGVEAALISFGILVNGTGAVFLDDVALEIVTDEISTTEWPHPETPHKPRNLRFRD